MVNVRSLEDEKPWWATSECSVVCFLATGSYSGSQRYQVFRMVLVDRRSFCSPDNDLFVAGLRPCYISRESSHAILAVFYVPASANPQTAGSCPLCCHMTPDSAVQCFFMISRVFSRTRLSPPSLSLWTPPPEETEPWTCCLLMLRGLEILPHTSLIAHCHWRSLALVILSIHIALNITVCQKAQFCWINPSWHKIEHFMPLLYIQGFYSLNVCCILLNRIYMCKI